MVKQILLILCLLLPTLSFADHFADIRRDTTYWYPYESEGIILVINKNIKELTPTELKAVKEAVESCQKDTDKTPGKYYYLYEKGSTIAGLTSKNWPKLSSIKYVADLNEIMLDVKKQVIKELGNI